MKKQSPDQSLQKQSIWPQNTVWKQAIVFHVILFSVYEMPLFVNELSALLDVLRDNRLEQFSSEQSF